MSGQLIVCWRQADQICILNILSNHRLYLPLAGPWPLAPPAHQLVSRWYRRSAIKLNSSMRMKLIDWLPIERLGDIYLCACVCICAYLCAYWNGRRRRRHTKIGIVVSQRWTGRLARPAKTAWHLYPKASNQLISGLNFVSFARFVPSPSADEDDDDDDDDDDHKWCQQNVLPTHVKFTILI